MLGKILGKFGESESVELESVDEADDVFSEKRGDRLNEINEKCEEFRDRAESVMNKLEDVLDELEGFEDVKSRAVIEDVVSNVVEERKKIVDSFEPPEDVEDLRDDLEEFLADYQEISRKEGAVIEEAGIGARFGDSLKKVKQLQEELEGFVEEKYSTKKRLEQIKRKVDELSELDQEIDSIQDRLDELDVKELEQSLEEKRKELEEFEDSDSMEELKDLKSRLEDKKAERNQDRRDVGSALSNMQRGLKKLLYEGEIGKVSKTGSDILREIRDKEKDKILDREPEKVEEAVSAVEDSLDDSLEGKTQEKLLKGVKELKDFSSTREKLEEIGVDIEELEEDIESHQAQERREEIQKQVDNLEEELEQEREGKKDLKQKLEKKRDERDSVRQNILSVIEKEFEGGVELGSKKVGEVKLDNN
jgi:chromosome segregation ATPase